jgi:L-cysteine:1D-myo-inositol 2-amino-2-deoxy-alpha-D-glucopyranoside ligase
MDVRLYDTLRGRVERFEPASEEVRIYVCGITPYDSTHLGHALTYVHSDVLIRFLRSRGHEIRYVQNLTDIDDAILRAAGERDENWRELGRRWTEYYIEDMKTLNILPPDHFPRATEHIPLMQEVVEKLLARGVAYESGGGVYFDTTSWDDFGKLSGLGREKMLPVANEHGNDPDDPRKQNALDFALWKAREEGEPSWESPWGPGRPGWHIECSTMATHYLGDTVDIHGGGSDLVFPHHEGEVAQSECATHEPFARFWFHTAMLRHEGEKMSKSTGNLVMARDLLEDHTPDALRLYLVRHHYRQSWEHDPAELERARKLADELRRAVEATSGGEAGSVLDPAREEDLFRERLADDLDTPGAVRLMEALAERILEGAVRDVDVVPGQQALREMGAIFGLRLDRTEVSEEVVRGWEGHGALTPP